MKKIDEKEILRRRDMRDAFTFTIDPADAKDFDDALSLMPLDNGHWQVGIHIADVSHYVKPGSKIDIKAYKRATSVYLVDHVEPMLPEELCNDLCSLRPNEEKLCMSVVLEMNDEAEVIKRKICRTVICSDHRLNYEQAQAILDGSNNETPQHLQEVLHKLNSIARKLRQRRIAAGALTVEQEEMRFKLDFYGDPVEIWFDQPSESHYLIEEFMLLANRTVAEAVGSKPFVYRIHDKPNQEKLDDVDAFRKRMGERVQQQTIDMLTIRAMAKAVYSTHNIGHYGLAFSHYCHFTSPIRRYPDVLVHRLLEKYILTGKGESIPQEELEEMCKHCSEMEQEAAEREREDIKYYAARFMARHVGEVMDSHVVGVTEFGLFVKADEWHCEGLVHISTLSKNDYFQYDEKNYRLIAARSSKTYTLGDALRVRCIRADAKKSQVDFVIVETE